MPRLRSRPTGGGRVDPREIGLDLDVLPAGTPDPPTHRIGYWRDVGVDRRRDAGSHVTEVLAPARDLARRQT